jgi:hypothetical protein
MTTSDKIRVVLGTDIKREAVLINPEISAADATNGSSVVLAKNVIAHGATSQQLAKKIYGRGV